MNTSIHPTLAAYEAAPTLSRWFESHRPSDSMLWKGGFAAQSEWMPRLATFGRHLEPFVLASHRSKSIALPVPAILVGNPAGEWAILMVRDNFYDVNVAVVSNVPLTIDHTLVYVEMTREEYQAEKERARGYAPMARRITDAQWKDGSWYGEWSSGSLKIINGKIYRAPRAFAEGIVNVPGVSIKPYTKDCEKFVTVLFGDAHILDRFGALADAVKANLNP